MARLFISLVLLLAADVHSEFRYKKEMLTQKWLKRMGYPRPAFTHMPQCALDNANSQQWLDLMMLGPLRCMTHGRPGTFVELGAFTGVNLSNTVMLERCYNWTGLLIEGSPANFAKLAVSGRKATKLHSAICPGDTDSFVEFTSRGGEISGEPALRTSGVAKNKQKRIQNELVKMQTAGTVKVPCRSLGRVLDAANYPKMDILFLDVEGAEAKVLSSIDPARFSIVIVEAPGFPKDDNGRHKTTVEPLLLNAGFVREERLEVGIFGTYNPVYVRRDAVPAHCIKCVEYKPHSNILSEAGVKCRNDWIGPDRPELHPTL